MTMLILLLMHKHKIMHLVSLWVWIFSGQVMSPGKDKFLLCVSCYCSYLLIGVECSILLQDVVLQEGDIN